MLRALREIVTLAAPCAGIALAVAMIAAPRQRPTPELLLWCGLDGLLVGLLIWLVVWTATRRREAALRESVETRGLGAIVTPEVFSDSTAEQLRARSFALGPRRDCPVCGGGPDAYLRCNYPGCPDGRQ